MPPAQKQPAMTAAFGEPIKQYQGQVQVTRSVRVETPGRHYNNLTGPEAQASYWATVVEFKERQPFPQHKAWGAKHTGPGIRYVCDLDAVDDPDHRGFWVPLHLWNRWRHETYKTDRDAEKQFLDELPAAPEAAKELNSAKIPCGAEIRKHFDAIGTGIHTVGGTGTMSGTELPYTLFACKKAGCARNGSKPIKQVGSATGDLFSHLDSCQPELAKQLRIGSDRSRLRIDEHGEEYSIYSFEELLPHHIRYVLKAFRSLDHFHETRANNGLLEYVQVRAPCNVCNAYAYAHALNTIPCPRAP